MHVEVDIEFDQLVKIVKKLPSKKLKQLKEAIESKGSKANAVNTLEKLLLNGPVATKKQLEQIAQTRNAINKWRG